MTHTHTCHDWLPFHIACLRQWIVVSGCHSSLTFDDDSVHVKGVKEVKNGNQRVPLLHHAVEFACRSREDDDNDDDNEQKQESDREMIWVWVFVDGYGYLIWRSKTIWKTWMTCASWFGRFVTKAPGTVHTSCISVIVMGTCRWRYSSNTKRQMRNWKEGNQSDRGVHIFCSELICQVLNEASEKCDGTVERKTTTNAYKNHFELPWDVCNEDPIRVYLFQQLDFFMFETVFFYFVLFK